MSEAGQSRSTYGVRFGFDVGTVRIGVARCDPAGLLAVPEMTLDASEPNQVAQTIQSLVDEYLPVEFVVGYPVTLAGRASSSAHAAEAFAKVLAAQHPGTSVRLVDERLSTMQAQRNMQQVGRSVKQSRGSIDQAAAVVILQQALDTERTSGRPAGRLVEI